jgi:hypothetical protein
MSGRRDDLQGVMFADPAVLPVDVLLMTRHYLGPSARSRIAYSDNDGVMLFANPASRNLPQRRWLELTRWCLTGGPNAGSKQWATARRWLRRRHPDITTVVSYSDPSVGHTGALYRACGWLWAPTWALLRPPPTRGGTWDGIRQQEVKHRWIAVLRPDPDREAVLGIHDAACERRFPWAQYQEPRWYGLRATGGGGDYQRWKREGAA